MYKKQLPPPKWNGKKWVLDVMIDGKRKQFTSQTPKTKGKREVIDRAFEWLETGLNKSIKLKDAYELYLIDYERRHGDNEQLRQIRSIFPLYILPRFSNVPLNKISIREWQSIINDAKPHKKNVKKLSKKYLSNIRGCIVSFCKWALLNEYIDRSPSEVLYIPSNAEKIGKEILQLSDIKKLFQDRQNLWYERAILLMILTGLRPGETLGIQKQDYNDGVLHISRSINANGRITSGKNKNAIRVIELPDEAKRLIIEQINDTANLRSKWLFCNRIGGQPKQDNLRNTLDILIKRHDLPNVTLYGLRHSFYSHVESYLPDRIIKTIFGHSEKTDGHNLYGKHTVNNEIHEAAKKLAVTPLYQIAK